MRPQAPKSRFNRLMENPLTPKGVFIVEDNIGQLDSLVEAINRSQHHLLGATDNFTDALLFIQQMSEEGVAYVALLDGNFPRIKDGKEEPLGSELAGAFTAANPTVGIISISDSWRGEWKDPLFDPEHPNRHKKEYDENGRKVTRGPDYNRTNFGFDNDRLMELIGRHQFSLRDQYQLDDIEYWAERHERWAEQERKS